MNKMQPAVYLIACCYIAYVYTVPKHFFDSPEDVQNDDPREREEQAHLDLELKEILRKLGMEAGKQQEQVNYEDFINARRLQENKINAIMGNLYEKKQPNANEFELDFEVDENWPEEVLRFGQVAGVAVDNQGNPHIFHRGHRVWDAAHRLFDENNVMDKENGPITEAVVVKLSRDTGEVLDKWGENRFYLPHGLTIDSEGNFWLTDVGLHQVFKFERGQTEPSLTLGTAFTPATNNYDETNFCKPTDVAVSSKGDFFVSDGYCNSRVMKFDSSGALIGQFGSGELNIPHSVALAEDLDLICVADRENRRILCYNAGLNNSRLLGRLERTYDGKPFGRVYSIDYNIQTGFLFGVNDNEKATGFTIDLHQDVLGEILDEWSPENQGFTAPHAIAVTPDCSHVYVGETRPNTVWKFDNIASEGILAKLVEKQQFYPIQGSDMHISENVDDDDSIKQ